MSRPASFPTSYSTVKVWVWSRLDDHEGNRWGSVFVRCVRITRVAVLLPNIFTPVSHLRENTSRSNSFLAIGATTPSSRPWEKAPIPISLRMSP